jgi:hypothetical protein
MNRQNIHLRDLTSQEYRKFILPSAIAGSAVLLTFLLDILLTKEIPPATKKTLIFLIFCSTIYYTVK